MLCIRYRHKSRVKYGYARVSTDGQSVATLVTALNAAGAGKVFREVASGAKTDRVQRWWWQRTRDGTIRWHERRRQCFSTFQ